MDRESEKLTTGQPMPAMIKIPLFPEILFNVVGIYITGPDKPSQVKRKDIAYHQVFLALLQVPFADIHLP